jgi:hypothetical protein
LPVQRGDQPDGAAYCTDAHRRLSLSSSPLSRRNHRSLRLVILSLCPELSRRRGNLRHWAVSSSLTKPSENGASSSARLMPTTCDDDLRSLATGGILMKGSSRSMGAFTTYGVQWIRTARYWMFWSRATEIRRQRRSSFANSQKGLRYIPRVVITDKLKSYSAVEAEVLPSIEHCHQKYQNNRAENSHQLTRLRERVMKRFKSGGHAQRFLSAFGVITSHFRVRKTSVPS